MADSPIGLIGVGLLGTALAERMLAAEFKVLGHDIAPSAGERLVHLAGGLPSPRNELADRCDTIVLCLPESNVVECVMKELHGQLRAGALIIDATTGDPEQTQAMARSIVIASELATSMRRSPAPASKCAAAMRR